MTTPRAGATPAALSAALTAAAATLAAALGCAGHTATPATPPPSATHPTNPPPLAPPPDPALARAQAELDQLRADTCACTDHDCAEAVSVRLADWTHRELPGTRSDDVTLALIATAYRVVDCIAYTDRADCAYYAIAVERFTRCSAIPADERAAVRRMLLDAQAAGPGTTMNEELACKQMAHALTASATGRGCAPPIELR
jgi:hypothetical protein